jgi:hypothetical protein
MPLFGIASGLDGLLDACVAMPVDNLVTLVDQVESTANAVRAHEQAVRELEVSPDWRHRCVPKFWTHRTKVYYLCDRSVREKAWRSRKRVTQAT